MDAKQIVSNLTFKSELGFTQEELVKELLRFYENDKILIQLSKDLLKCKNQSEVNMIQDLMEYRQSIIIEHLKKCNDKT